ncbi:MAG TPA: hypothetical protein VH079_09410 [Terriglobales bacterium]|nr:hypothetical protein [Terriglobales bacterium]
MNDAPNFLVEWSSPWHEFRTAIRPALSRSPEALSGEAPVGLFPYRGMLVSWVFEVAFVVALIMLSTHLAEMRSLEPTALIKPEIVYYSGKELPRTEDTGGTRAGRSGRGGGHQAHHPTQTIRVARGEVLHERVVDAPRLNLPRSESAVANLLAYKANPGPVPVEGLKSSQRAQHMQMQAIAPSPEVQNEKMRSAPTLNASVVAPAPIAPQRDITSPRMPGNQPMQVVPPPVSAPEKFSSQNPRLTLPAPAVVAPPPQLTHEKVTPGPGFGAEDLHSQVVPPPAQVASNSRDHRTFGGMGTNTSVVPPTAQLNDGSMQRRPSNELGGGATVVPPMVQLNNGSTQRQASAGLGGSAAVVPPSPTLNGGSSEARGNRGKGLGSPTDAGVMAPPKDSGSGTAGTGVVVSSQPGSKQGVPANTPAGALALSPSGGATPGLGGSGGGSSIGRGTDSGSGLTGKDAGAGKSGDGRGSDTTAHSGISPYAGTGGAGNGTTAKPPMPGVSVSGGSNIVTLPSFGTNGNQPSDPEKLTTKKDDRPGITVVASSRSGGAFNFYGTLKGDKVYTIYIDTNLGTAVMEFADPNSVGHGGEDLTAPRPMRASVVAPPNMKRGRLVIACVLDRTGIVKNARVLESGAVEMTAKVMTALPGWKFSPVLRGNQPVEVNAILGFDIDTR